MLNEGTEDLVLVDGRAAVTSKKPDAHRGAGDVLVRPIMQQKDAGIGGDADAGHEARMAQRLLDGRGLVKVDREVGIAGRAGEARDEAHVQVVQAGLHHGTLLPLDVGLHIALHEPIECLIVKDVVLAIFVEEENTAETDRVVGRRNNHLQTETTAVEHQFHRAGEVERLPDEPGNGFHEAACASLHGAAAVYVGIQNEATSTGVGDAADQLEAFRVTPSGPARDRKRRFGWEHNGLSYPGSTVALHYI